MGVMARFQEVLQGIVDLALLARGPLFAMGQRGIDRDAMQPGAEIGVARGNRHRDRLCRFEKDELRVYTLKTDGKFNALLWHDEQQGGLTAPTLQLFRQLKSNIEASYPTTPKRP